MTLKTIQTLVKFVLAACFLSVLSCKGSGEGTLHVMSYNIRDAESNDGDNNWPFREAASAEMLEDLRPDVFGVQEAVPVQIDYLTAHPGFYENVGVGREDGVHEGEHMSVFYNKNTMKLLKWGTFWLSETPDVPSIGWDAKRKRTATWALLKDRRNGEKFYFVNTHLDHVGWEARRKGLALIVDRIDSINPEGWPMVLTGDFNMTPERPEFDELNKRMTSVRTIAEKTDTLHTFNGWDRMESCAVDFIYVKGFSEYPLYETVTKQYAGREYISDHYPVRAVLKY